MNVSKLLLSAFSSFLLITFGVGAEDSLLPRCCLPHQIFSAELQKCVLPNADVPVFTCPNHTQLFHFKTKIAVLDDPNVEVREPVFNTTLKEGQFCIHETDESDNEAIVLFCHPKPTQIVVKKCCPNGFGVDKYSAHRCSPIDAEFSPESFIDPLNTYEIESNSTIQCSHYKIFLPEMYIDHKFHVEVSGLVLEQLWFKSLRRNMNYCVDLTQGPNQTQVVAFECEPKSVYAIQYFVHHIYPFLLFFSSLFMLATMLVYIMIRRLRDNIQGYSMICFLISLICDQMERGSSFLAHDDENLASCGKKIGMITTFFRMASSAWVTVMGFNIRNLLCRGGTGLAKKSFHNNFVRCSIYAWGTPLIYTAAIYSIAQDSRKTCSMFSHRDILIWFLPIVLLNLFNLVFFIPSARKVYASLDFIKDSVSTEIKLERQRIGAIFRLFFLMEFLGIPMIGLLITSHFELPPLFLIISAVLYLFEGPLIFYFFVCKRETIDLIKQLFRSKEFNSVAVSISSSLSLKSSLYNSSYNLTQVSKVSSSNLDIGKYQLFPNI